MIITICWTALVLGMSIWSLIVNAKTRTKIGEANKRIEESNQRLNILSRENARLYEENFRLKDKLKNLGFTEEKLK